jgi:type IV secretion system protein VirB9
MIVRRCLALLFAISATAPEFAAAQAFDNDGRITTLAYRSGETMTLRSAPGNSLTIIFAPGETIQAVDLGDGQAFNVSLSSTSDSLTLRTYSAPTDPHLTVHTQLRQYNFVMQVGSPSEATYVVRFAHGSELAPSGQTAHASGGPSQAGTNAAYRLSGTRSLRPARISDDGAKTYLEWGEDQALPAVFAINSVGEEEMVDGYMRGSVFTIDRVNRELVFRIGKKSAKAQRQSD